MPEPLVLNDDTLDAALNEGKPVLMVFADSGLRGDFNAAFKQAAEKHAKIKFAKLNPVESRQCAERFGVGSKPVMIGWYNGEEILRRSRPWGSDVPLAVEMLEAAYQSANPEVESEEQETVNNHLDSKADDKPVVVTDATFQKEVIDYSDTTPVLVDFWAAWCGPCRMVAPILEKLAAEYAGRVRIAKVDVDANPGLSQTFRIQSIPTIMLLKDRTIVFQQPGALPEAGFRQLLDQLIDLEIPQEAVEERQPE